MKPKASFKPGPTLVTKTQNRGLWTRGGVDSPKPDDGRDWSPGIREVLFRRRAVLLGAADGCALPRYGRIVSSQKGSQRAWLHNRSSNASAGAISATVIGRRVLG
jgi:hypothetical protein